MGEAVVEGQGDSCLLAGWGSCRRKPKEGKAAGEEVVHKGRGAGNRG